MERTIYTVDGPCGTWAYNDRQHAIEVLQHEIVTNMGGMSIHRIYDNHGIYEVTMNCFPLRRFTVTETRYFDE